MKKIKKVSHIIPYNVYGFKFIKLVDGSNVSGEHSFFFYSFSGTPTYSVDDYPKSRHKVSKISKNFIINWITLLVIMIKSDIVIQHGLFDPRHIVGYNFVPFLKKKLFWFVWGGDLYYGFDLYEGFVYRILSMFRGRLLKKIPNVLSALNSDLDLFKINYNPSVNARFLPYSYDLDFATPIELIENNGLIRIMVGNNATTANYHFRILEKIFNTIELNKSNLRILLPLSYGDIEYANSVANYAVSLFGDKIEILKDFMNIKDYNKILLNVDVAILDHDMPQGMGVLLQLLAYGKKVYIKSTNSLFHEFGSKNIKVFDSLSSFKEISVPLSKKASYCNYEQTYLFYSNITMVENWVNFFDSI